LFLARLGSLRSLRRLGHQESHKRLRNPRYQENPQPLFPPDPLVNYPLLYKLSRGNSKQ
jgi:hypothetical protein